MSGVSLAPVFKRQKNGGFSIKLILIISFILAAISFVAISLLFGLDKQDQFEIAIISIDWITLIIVGIMLFNLFRKEEKICLTTTSI